MALKKKKKKIDHMFTPLESLPSRPSQNIILYLLLPCMHNLLLSNWIHFYTLSNVFDLKIIPKSYPPSVVTFLSLIFAKFLKRIAHH